jgi:phage gpG-like protein
MPPEPSISITLSPGLQALMRSGPAAIVHGAVAKALDQQNELTIGAAVRDRMSFPRGVAPTMEGLRVQSGHLRRSITRSRARVTASGAESAIGSNVRYFGPHEFGFDGSVTVKEHRRKLPDRYLLTSGQIIDRSTAERAGFMNKARNQYRARMRKGIGEQLPDRYVMVSQHTRQAHVPARQMVRRTVAARMPAYGEAIAAQVRAALGGTQA